MSELSEAGRQLAKASYYYGECSSELDHVKTHSKRLGEIIQGIADLLPLLGEKWLESSEVSQQTIGRADKVASGMENAFHLLESIPEKFRGSLASHLGNVYHGTYIIKESAEYIRGINSTISQEEFSQLSAQFSDSVANVEHSASLTGKTQQHFADVSDACAEYMQHL